MVCCMGFAMVPLAGMEPGCCSIAVWSCEAWLGAWDGGSLYGLTE